MSPRARAHGVRALPALFLVLFVAGCATPGSVVAPVPEGPEAPTFTAPAILDPTRSGGEPVLFISPTGTMFYAAHPGYTHVKAPPGPEVLTPSSGQSYLWRSDDGGDTWTLVTGATENAPRNAALGFSDPDLASNEDGSRLVWTDLQVLAGISTAASTDDGRSWPDAQPAAAAPGDSGVDRPWLAYAKGTFYLLYNGDGAGHWRLRASADGVTWRHHSTPGDGSYPGAMIADPTSGALYVGNGDKVWWSEDGGLTFEPSPIPSERALTGIVAQRPSVDAAGNVYFAWSEQDSIWFAASRDHARTWSAPVKVSANGTHIWPWPVAGAEGKLAIVWLGTDDAVEDVGTTPAEWRVHVALVDGAASDAPAIWSAPVENAVATRGAICLNGTFCEVEGKDRRLGDFITAAIDSAGKLHVAYGTTETEHSISSPAYFRQESGFALR